MARSAAISFNAALSATAKAGKWREALNLLERMKASPRGGPRPDVLSYNAVLGAFERSGEWRRVAPLLDEMEAAGVPPNVATLTAAMQAVASAGQLNEGFTLLERARRLKIAVKGVDTYSLHRTLLDRTPSIVLPPRQRTPSIVLQVRCSKRADLLVSSNWQARSRRPSTASASPVSLQSPPPSTSDRATRWAG